MKEIRVSYNLINAKRAVDRSVEIENRHLYHTAVVYNCIDSFFDFRRLVNVCFVNRHLQELFKFKR